MLDSAEACLKLTPPPGPGMYDLEFGVKFSPIHHSLASSDITPVSAAEQFATLLTEFLESKPDLVEEAKEFFAHNPEAHTDLESARKLKKPLEEKVETHRCNS